MRAAIVEDQEPLVVKVMLRTGLLGGEVVEETGATLVVGRIKTANIVTLSKEDLLSAQWSPTDEELIATEGLCPYVV